MTTWNNYFVTSLSATGKDGHIPAEYLRNFIAKHDGSEAYHCAYDLEPRENFNGYSGLMRPALDRVWFDFDSKDGGEQARQDTINFVQWLEDCEYDIYFSGNKGFHVGVAFGHFGLDCTSTLSSLLALAANRLKEQFKTLDTTIYNANRKFRVLGSKHPKSGLYKISLRFEDLKKPLEQIRFVAKERGILTIRQFNKEIKLFNKLSSLFVAPAQKQELACRTEKQFNAPQGTSAFEKCGFLQHCRDNQDKISEPQWFAALSVVCRFQDGPKQCHQISYKHPGYTVSDTNDKVTHALNESGPRTCENIATLYDGCARCPLFGKISSPVAIYETKFWTIGKKGNLIPQYEELLEEFIKEKKYFVDPIREVIYVWSGTHYEIATDIHINAWCEEKMLPAPSAKVANEFRAKVFRNNVKNDSELDSFFYATTKGKLNLQNGVLDIVKGDLSPHNENIGFRHCLPYSYDPAAKATLFNGFLQEVTMSREPLQQTLLEYMGYCLWPDFEDHSFLWLSGTGRNGKSTFLEIVQALVGKENCSNVLLSSFEKPNYLQMMDHKLVNIAEESDEPKIPATIMGNLKAMSSGANVQVDQKFQVPYSMRCTAKLLFAANRAPIFPGTETAVKSRMIVVPFDLELEQHSATGTESRIDWSLTENMKKELPGILNMAISALRGYVLRSPRKIFRSDISHAATNEILRNSDSVEEWFQDCVEVLKNPTDGGVLLSDLYIDFKNSLIDPDKAMEAHWFSRRLQQKLGKKCVVKKEQKYGKRTRVFYGISIKNNAEF